MAKAGRQITTERITGHPGPPEISKTARKSGPMARPEDAGKQITTGAVKDMQPSYATEAVVVKGK